MFNAPLSVLLRCDADQRRRSGEDFIIHPVGVAKICAGMRLDTETLCAALLHDTVEDTSASLEEVRVAFRVFSSPATSSATSRRICPICSRSASSTRLTNLARANMAATCPVTTPPGCAARSPFPERISQLNPP